MIYNPVIRPPEQKIFEKKLFSDILAKFFVNKLHPLTLNPEP